MKATIYYTEDGKAKRKKVPLLQSLCMNYGRNDDALFYSHIDVVKQMNLQEKAPATWEKIIISFND